MRTSGVENCQDQILHGDLPRGDCHHNNRSIESGLLSASARQSCSRPTVHSNYVIAVADCGPETVGCFRKVHGRIMAGFSPIWDRRDGTTWVCSKLSAVALTVRFMTRSKVWHIVDEIRRDG